MAKNPLGHFFRFCVFFLPVFGRPEEVEKDSNVLTCGFENTAF